MLATRPLPMKTIGSHGARNYFEVLAMAESDTRQISRVVS